MARVYALIVVAFASYVCDAWARPEAVSCTEVVQVEGGAACGLRRVGSDGGVYASFRAVPYARQPLHELRFKELQPVEPWSHLLDATQDGPVCPQYDIFYRNLVPPSRNMSEACIHANIHVPVSALPAHRPPRANDTGLPVLVFIHGGAFAFGSGDADVYGPEYLVSKGIIVITFNYRLNVFGFLSLNSSSIPGNAGLRDQVTLLRWVQRNARAFGGDPDEVTIAGQSAGAASAHLLTLSPATEGLFNKAIIMSGTAIQTFYTASPQYAKVAADLLLGGLGINSTDPEEIHNELTEMPLERIMEVHKALLDQFGLTVFAPVIESPVSDATLILDDEPEALLDRGRGRDYPLMIGHTSSECETFRPRFEEIDIIDRVMKNPLLVVPAKVTYTQPPEVSFKIAKDIVSKYFHGAPTMEEYTKLCSDSFLNYAAIRLALQRADQEAAQTYLYKFSYENEHNLMRTANRLSYEGAAHVEDMTYVFRNNFVLGEPQLYAPDEYDSMREWMSAFIVNFMRCSNPTCNNNYWQPVNIDNFYYQDVVTPNIFQSAPLTRGEEHMIKFFDSIHGRDSLIATVDPAE